MGPLAHYNNPSKPYNLTMKTLTALSLMLLMAASAQAASAAEDIVFELKDNQTCFSIAMSQIKTLINSVDDAVRMPTRLKLNQQATKLCKGANDDAPAVCHRAAFPVIMASGRYSAVAASDKA